MKKQTGSKKAGDQLSVGQEIITSLKEAIAWAGGEDVPVRVTAVKVPTTDVRAVRRKLGLSQSEFAAKFGFQPATLKNWEQGRTRPDGPARVLLAVIERHPEAVEDTLRKACQVVEHAFADGGLQAHAGIQVEGHDAEFVRFRPTRFATRAPLWPGSVTLQPSHRRVARFQRQPRGGGPRRRP